MAAAAAAKLGAGAAPAPTAAAAAAAGDKHLLFGGGAAGAADSDSKDGKDKDSVNAGGAAGGGAVDYIPSPLSASIASDPCDFLLGAWKRNLEWRSFSGAFPVVRTTNTVVVVDEYHSSVAEPGVRYLKWCFGKTLDKHELRFGYVMKVRRSHYQHYQHRIPQHCTEQHSTASLRLCSSLTASDSLCLCLQFRRDPKSVDPADETVVEWQYNGHACSGVYQPATAAAVFNFHLKSSTVVITYRLLSAHTMAVCIVELDEQHTPTVQLGNMLRIDPALYQTPAHTQTASAPPSRTGTVARS
jgi:hypothetical protein